MTRADDENKCDGVKAALPQRVPKLSGLARWPLPPAEVYEVFSQALRNLKAAPRAVGDHVGISGARYICAPIQDREDPIRG